MGHYFDFMSFGKETANSGNNSIISNNNGSRCAPIRRRRLPGAYMLVIGILIGALLFGGGVAMAVSAFSATPSSSSVFVDGKEIYTDAFLIEGANYFKLRDIAKALNVGVWYDEYKDNVYVETDIDYDPQYTGVRETVQQIQPQVQITPFQKSLTVDVDNKKQFDLEASATRNYSAAITIIELIRGEEAANTIKAASVHNPSAGLGKEFVLALVRAKVKETSDKKNVVLADIRLNMHCYSSDGVLYPSSNPLNINPLNEQPKKVGETVLGWIAFAVDRNDPEPRVQIGTVAGSEEPAWFALFD